MISNKKQQKPNKIGLEYFNVSTLSSQIKNQLLKPNKSKYLTNFNPELCTTNIKKENNYLDSLMDEFKFSHDVVAERCIHLLPYSEKFYDTVYAFKGSSKKRVSNQIFDNKYILPTKHICPTNVKDIYFKPLPPVEISKKSPEKQICKKYSDPIVAVASENDTEYPRKYWDEYMLSLMSQNTAQYVAFDLITEDKQAIRLQKLVESWYGPPPEYRELIPDDSDDSTEKTDLKSIFPYKYYMDLIKTKEEKVTTTRQTYEIEESPRKKIQNLIGKEKRAQTGNNQTDPYGDETKASFYRLPVLVRRTKKINQETNIEQLNRTTTTLEDFKLPETPPKLVNHKIGDKVLQTDSQFEQDLFINEDSHQRKLLGFPDDAVCVNDKIYRKKLQPIWPSVVTAGLPTEEQLNSHQIMEGRIVKGHNRWTKLPVEQQKDLLNAKDISDSEDLERQMSRKRARDHSSLNLLVDQWRKKWQLTQKYTDSTTDELLRDMTDVHPTIRIQAIVTAAKAASLIHDQKYGQIDSMKETISSESLPSVLISAIEILLDDTHIQVRKAASIALHSLEKSTEKSITILQTLLLSESNVDRWSAVQCLALSNKCDNHVIGELVNQLMNSEDIIVHEKASFLLAKISYHTKLVHGMLGERLNTISWRQRVIICKTIPLLRGSLNKDLLRKIIHIMWNDPHKQVRIAASQVLGKTGNGKAVHDVLIKKLESESELVRADALEKIGILKVMTTRLMPAFLKCFRDEFFRVRKEICRACSRLKIQDKICIDNLLEIARFDPLWRVRLYATRALSKTKSLNSEIQSCFLWTLQFESEIKLRLEALMAISSSPSFDQNVVEIIKSRFLVENDKSILQVLKKIMTRVNINPDNDIDTVAEVKSEVRRFLSDKNHIIDIILFNEAADDYEFMRQSMIAQSSTDEMETDDADNESRCSDEESVEDEDEIEQARKTEVCENVSTEIDKVEDIKVSSTEKAAVEVIKEIIDILDSDFKNSHNSNNLDETGEPGISDNNDKIEKSATDYVEKIKINEMDKGSSFVESIERIDSGATTKNSAIMNEERAISSKQSERKKEDDKFIDKILINTDSESPGEVEETPDSNMDINFELNKGPVDIVGEQEVNLETCVDKFDPVEVLVDEEVPSENVYIDIEPHNFMDEDDEQKRKRIENDYCELNSNDEGFIDVPSSEIQNNELIPCLYTLPRDSSHIKIYYLDNSFIIPTQESCEYNYDTQRLEATLDKNIINQVYEAINETGLDFGPLENIL